jgi:hypothetical protein
MDQEKTEKKKTSEGAKKAGSEMNRGSFLGDLFFLDSR